MFKEVIKYRVRINEDLYRVEVLIQDQNGVQEWKELYHTIDLQEALNICKGGRL